MVDDFLKMVRRRRWTDEERAIMATEPGHLSSVDLARFLEGSREGIDVHHLYRCSFCLHELTELHGDLMEINEIVAEFEG